MRICYPSPFISKVKSLMDGDREDKAIELIQNASMPYIHLNKRTAKKVLRIFKDQDFYVYFPDSTKHQVLDLGNVTFMMDRYLLQNCDRLHKIPAIQSIRIYKNDGGESIPYLGLLTAKRVVESLPIPDDKRHRVTNTNLVKIFGL